MQKKSITFLITKSKLMKKLFFLFATVTLLTVFQSCKQKPAEETPAEETTELATEAVTTDSTATNAEDTGRIPIAPTDPKKGN